MAANLEPADFRTTGRVATVAILILAAAFALLGVERTGAAAQTFTVIGTADTGGTCPTISTCAGLRQAILSANGNGGADTIVFNITGSGPHTFTPATVLPTITEAVTIDGFCANCDGATANTAALFQPINAVYKIIIDGPGTAVDGFVINTAGAVVIKGLNIRDFGTGRGIRFASGGSHVVRGNFFGTNETGTAISGTTGILILVDGTAGAITIGGPNPADRNLLSGASNSAVHACAAGAGMTVQGNYFGTNAAGTAAISNVNGFTTCKDNVKLGGSGTGQGNLIAGSGIGVSAGSQSNLTVEGNRFGTNAAGTAALAGIVGITASNLNNSTIGTTAAGGGNLFAGTTNGAIILQPATNVDVVNNSFGLNLAGNAAIPIGNAAVNIIGGTNIDVGVTGANGGNRFGGDKTVNNNSRAVGLSNAWSDIRIRNNIIGLGVGGENVGMEDMGINIGGTGTNLDINGNTVVGGAATGILIVPDNPSTGIVVKNNRIGITPANAPMGNLNGILVGLTAALIGGTGVNDPNVIANNASDGIVLTGLTEITNVTITRNRIFNNGTTSQQLGIDIANDGTPANDDLDADTGPNGALNRPEVDGLVFVDGDHIVVPILIRSVPNQEFKVEFFRNTVCPSNANGQGEFYIDETLIITNGFGLRGLNIQVPGIAYGERFAATMTDENGNTSEFSSGSGCNQAHRPFLDANCDFDVSAADALAVMNRLAGFDVGNVAQECEEEPAPSPGDVNDDSTEDMGDVLAILRYEAGLTDILGNPVLG